MQVTRGSDHFVSPQEKGHPLPSGLLTFLLTDIEGSTRRWEDEPGAMRIALARHDELLRREILALGGHIFRTVGDSFHAAFSIPTAAITAALNAQRLLTTEDFSSVKGLKVRMALHAGVAEARDGDYFGPAMNRAARLLSVAYGGQVLVAGMVAELLQGMMPAQSSLYDLGRHRFRDLPGSEQVYQLIAPGIEAAFPPLRSLGAKIYQLPRTLTSIIDREREIAEVKSRLSKYQLLTLTGSGGCGKTRIAIQVGWELLDDYPDGVWFVELAPLDNPELVSERVCSVIGIPVQGSDTARESAIGFLREKRALVILDNCEHLITAAAQIAETIVQRCPGVSVLTTSREPLCVMGESTFRVPSLSVPPQLNVTAVEALKFGAVRLFVERATATIDGFTINDSNAQPIADICSHLDGIPLAIELAVPRLKIMQPEELAARLQDRFKLLISGNRTAIPRHQTLTTLLDWSYNLLNDSEQTLLRRLSVFTGGWTLRSAEQICGGAPIGEAVVIDLLSSLTDKSLVIADLSSKEPRYRLLETTRQYAFTKLRGHGERGRRRKLAEYMVQFHGESFRTWSTTATDVWLSATLLELDNLRAALEWAFSSEGDLGLGLELTSYSLRIWDELSLLSERDRWFLAATAHQELAIPVATAGRLWLGRTSTSSHGDRSAFDPAKRAAEFFRSANDQMGLGEALTRAGAAVLRPESTAEANPYLDEALEVLGPLGSSKQLASCLRSKAVATYFVGDFGTARPLLERSVKIARKIGDTRGVVNAQIAIAEMEYASGDAEAAVRTVRELINGNLHNLRQLALGLGNLTSYLLALGQTREAALVAFNGLHKARALRWPAAVARVLEHLALIAALTGDPEKAARLLGHTVAFYRQGTASREYTEQTSYDRLVEDLREKMTADRVRELMSEGAEWTEDCASEKAFQVQATKLE